MNVDKATIRAGLEELGIVPGDVLLVHSSLRSFGYVNGGADTVIDALLEAVGDNGTILVPTLTFKVLKSSPRYFSVIRTPSSSGKITETFRRRPGARRSRHPVSSASAIGPQADFLTSGHEDTPCGPDSPYYRLYELGGKVVFFGASLGSNTLFHCAEEIAAPAYLGYTTIENAIVEDAGGRRQTVTARRYDCFDRGVVRHLANMEPLFRKRGLLRRTEIGHSRSYLITAHDNVRVSCEVLTTDPEYILSPLP